jgi:hypothetical protein
MTHTLRAGASRVELPAASGVPMMGYGARTVHASGLHDPLFARAVYFESQRESQRENQRESGRALLVECDLCLLSVRQCDAVRRSIAARTRLGVGEIAIGCVHTHSGPDTGLVEEASGREAPEYLAALFAAIVEAGLRAVRAAEPARLGVGVCAASIGRNRRRAGAAIDERVWVLRVDRRSGAPLAVLYVHGCHPTVLGHDNTELSADWPGAASQRVEEAFPGAVAIFGLGAHGDVDPRTRGLQDLVKQGQSQGASFERVRELGGEIGEAVAKTAQGIRSEAEVTVRASTAQVELSTHGGDGEQRSAHLAELRADALAALDLEDDPQLRSADFYRLEHERTESYAEAERRARISRVRLYLRDRHALRIAGGAHVSVEVQLLELGPLLLLALPFEATVDVGVEWSRRAGGEYAALLSIANGWLRYLPHAAHFSAERAQQQYEVLNSTFECSAADRLLAAGAGLLGSAGPV